MFHAEDILSKETINLLNEVLSVARAKNLQAYVIGGLIRDILVGGSFTPDVDITLSGSAIDVAREIERRTKSQVTIKEFEAFNTAKLIDRHGIEVDLATCRSESYRIPGSLPVIQNGTFTEDIDRRDFTINTLSVELSQFLKGWNRKDIIDHAGGLKDLDERSIKVLHEKSFEDDPTRILRGIRYVVRLGASFETKTEELIKEAARNASLRTISCKRFLNELARIIVEQNPKRTLELAANYKLFSSASLIREEDESKLSNLATAEPEQRWELLQWGLLYFSETRREELLKAYGWKKKKIKEVLEELEAIKIIKGEEDSLKIETAETAPKPVTIAAKEKKPTAKEGSNSKATVKAATTATATGTGTGAGAGAGLHQKCLYGTLLETLLR